MPFCPGPQASLADAPLLLLKPRQVLHPSLARGGGFAAGCMILGAGWSAETAPPGRREPWVMTLRVNACS